MELRDAILHHEFLLNRLCMIWNKKRFVALQSHLKKVLLPILSDELVNPDLITATKNLLKEDGQMTMKFEIEFKDPATDGHDAEMSWKNDCHFNLQKLKEWYNKEYML